MDDLPSSATNTCAPRGVFPTYATQAWWEFEQNDAGFAFIDSSDGGNDLTTTYASSAISTANGVAGRALYRGGKGSLFADRRIFIPRSNSRLDFGAAESFTIGCWVKAQSTMVDNWTHIILGRAAMLGTSLGVDATYEDDSYHLGVLNGTLIWTIVQEGVVVRSVNGGSIASVGTWQLLIGVCDLEAGLLRFYVNAVEIATTAITAGPQRCVGANFCVSHPQRNDNLSDIETAVVDRQFDGCVDKAFVVPRALRALEISYLYNSGAGRSYADALANGIMVSA